MTKRNNKYLGYGRKAKLSTKKKTRTKILVVCEGTKTEPNYFDYLKVKANLQNVDIKIISAKYSTPKSVFDSAVRANQEARNKAGRYQHIYCVFDRDKHESFASAIKQIKLKKNFNAIYSDPCFELWLLYHFQPYNKIASTCNDVEKILQTKLPNYNKNLRNSQMDMLHQNLRLAINHAKQSYQKNSPNPSTAIHKMIFEIHLINKNNVLA